MKVKFMKVDPRATIPVKSSTDAACYDIETIETFSMVPEVVYKVRTGLSFELPAGYEMEIRPRSGLSSKSITIVNSPGTLDADYRGELLILLRNDTRKRYHVLAGSRIAQIKINKVLPVEFEEVTELSETTRGSGGFGSTG